jgi:hypothetical protein
MRTDRFWQVAQRCHFCMGKLRSAIEHQSFEQVAGPHRSPHCISTQVIIASTDGHVKCSAQF